MVNYESDTAKNQKKQYTFLKFLKYVHHTYSLVALIGFMMCPAVHDLANGTFDHIVIDGRTTIQKLLHKTAKNTSFTDLVIQSGYLSDSFVNPVRKVTLYPQQSVNNSITLLSTTHLIL